MKSRIAFICPPLQGHINPMISIAKGLKDNGYNIVFIGLLEIANNIKIFDFIPIGGKTFSIGDIRNITKRMSKLKGMRMGRVWQKQFTNKWSNVVCEELPEVIKREEISFIVCDQLEPAVALVADYLKIPFITVCNAMAIVMDLTLPPFFVSWDYDVSDRRLKINNGFYMVADILLKHDTRVLEDWRKKWNMPERIGMERYFAVSKIATLSQQTESLEFPLTKVNKNWHYCGPFRDNTLLPYILPELSLYGKKTVYISLGSLQGSRFKLIKKCVTACKNLNLRAVVVHAGLLNDDKVSKLKKCAEVFDYLKQPDIFEYCDFLISHCGLNTALDALTYGRPIVAIPIGIEQGAIATKLKRVGCAVVVKRLKQKKIRKGLSKILKNTEFKENCEKIRQEILSAGGLDKAVRVIATHFEKHNNSELYIEKKAKLVVPPEY